MWPRRGEEPCRVAKDANEVRHGRRESVSQKNAAPRILAVDRNGNTTSAITAKIDVTTRFYLSTVRESWVMMRFSEWWGILPVCL